MPEIILIRPRTWMGPVTREAVSAEAVRNWWLMRTPASESKVDRAQSSTERKLI
jgi:hypothetical protein